MGVSFDPEAWEKLRDLRERHERLARRSDEVLRGIREGSATEEDYRSAIRAEREAYQAWRTTRVEDFGDDPTLSPDDEREEVPRDV